MEYEVNADFCINVSVTVDAESEEEAIVEAKSSILNKDCDWLDPLDEPKINFVEKSGHEDPDRQCFWCGQESCDCDML